MCDVNHRNSRQRVVESHHSDGGRLADGGRSKESTSMLVDTVFHHLAASLFHKHGEGALTYALRNARMLGSKNSELEDVWMCVARKIEHLVSTTAEGRG